MSTFLKPNSVTLTSRPAFRKFSPPTGLEGGGHCNLETLLTSLNAGIEKAK